MAKKQRAKKCQPESKKTESDGGNTSGNFWFCFFSVLHPVFIIICVCLFNLGKVTEFNP